MEIRATKRSSIVRTAPVSPIPDLLTAWRQDHNTCPEPDLCRIEARHAASLGLPTLAALYETLDCVHRAAGPVSPVELEALLRPILQVARGEATERIRLILGKPANDGVPGLGMNPRRLLETSDRRHPV